MHADSAGTDRLSPQHEVWCAICLESGMYCSINKSVSFNRKQFWVLSYCQNGSNFFCRSSFFLSSIRSGVLSTSRVGSSIQWSTLSLICAGWWLVTSMRIGLKRFRYSAGCWLLTWIRILLTPIICRLVSLDFEENRIEKIHTSVGNLTLLEELTLRNNRWLFICLDEERMTRNDTT